MASRTAAAASSSSSAGAAAAAALASVADIAPYAYSAFSDNSHISIPGGVVDGGVRGAGTGTGSNNGGSNSGGSGVIGEALDALTSSTSTPADFGAAASAAAMADVSCYPPSSDFSFYLNGVCMALIIAMGVAGNLMSMIVLTRRAMHTSTNCFLTALAIWDSVVLVVCLFLVTLNELSEPFREHVFPYVVVYVYPLALSAQTATVWLTVSFTVERYIAVCHPLRAARMCTIPRARLVVVVISVVCVLYNVPRWFEYVVVETALPGHPDNKTCLVPGTTTLANDSIYHKIYFGWLYFLVMCFIPLCSLAVLNAFLITAVRRSQRQRQDMMNVQRQTRENNVTIMLVFVVMVFIICQVPALIYNMAYAIDMPLVKASEGWGILSNFRNFLVTLNSAINFILYCALGQKFRRTFVRTFCACIFKKMSGGRFQSFSFNGGGHPDKSAMMHHHHHQRSFNNGGGGHHLHHGGHLRHTHNGQGHRYGNSLNKVMYKECGTKVLDANGGVRGGGGTGNRINNSAGGGFGNYSMKVFKSKPNNTNANNTTPNTTTAVNNRIYRPTSREASESSSSSTGKDRSDPQDFNFNTTGTTGSGGSGSSGSSLISRNGSGGSGRFLHHPSHTTRLLPSTDGSPD